MKKQIRPFFLFLAYFKALEKKTLKSDYNFFSKKTHNPKFSKICSAGEISADPQFFFEVGEEGGTLGPRKYVETRARIFLTLFCFLCNFL